VGNKTVLQDMDLKNPFWVRELGIKVKGLRIRELGLDY
jgi:hypothetical protein